MCAPASCVEVEIPAPHSFNRVRGQGDEATVFHYLTRLVSDRELAEDLAQECWLRVWRARHFYRPEAAFRTWLFTVARRLVLDHAKSPRLLAGPLTDR